MSDYKKWITILVLCFIGFNVLLWSATSRAYDRGYEKGHVDGQLREAEGYLDTFLELRRDCKGK